MDKRRHAALRRTERLVWRRLDKRSATPAAFFDNERGFHVGSDIETEGFRPGFRKDGQLHNPP